jgi:hypothetical protein
MLENFAEFAAALPEPIHEAALQHLRREDRQEDICFALWRPSCGRRRLTALVFELLLPKDAERSVHGNASFEPQYFIRAAATAAEKGAGMLLMHSHLGPGWQDLSQPDFEAEAGHAGAATGATGLPLLGMTVATDAAWSARFWRRTRPRAYEPAWCDSVRIVGDCMQITYHPLLRPTPVIGPELQRSAGVWGRRGHMAIANLHAGIVGLGSVGSIVCEALARMGVEWLTLIDYDEIEHLNLDRILGATLRDIGRLKIDVAADNAQRSSTAQNLKIDRYDASVVEEEGYRASLDCDVLFSCVDRPWARRVLNHIAYAHLIPVIDGGILVHVRRDRLVGADWHVHTVGPGRRCLECLEAFDPSLVGVERDGLLDDPSYLAQLDPDHVLLRHENVFPFSLNVASLQVLQMATLIVGPIPNLGNQNYHYASGTLDRIDDHGCDPSCPYPLLLATGDLTHAGTGLDHAAEKHCQKVLG